MNCLMLSRVASIALWTLVWISCYGTRDPSLYLLLLLLQLPILLPSTSLYYQLISKLLYSLRSILLFANTDVSITKMCLDTSLLAKSIMSRREY
jgi:hypothetical protein